MLIFPLGKPGTHGIPLATLFVCVICMIVQMFVTTTADRQLLAFYPDQLDPLRMLTSVLTHADTWHLVGNLFFFYCFARTIEAQISFAGYLMAFVVFVLVTNLAYSATAELPIPTLGLSGVVWGFMGVFLLRYPRDDIECWVWFLGKVNVPAFVFILAFLVLDLVAFGTSEVMRVNYAAHFSGFAAGVLFKLLLWNSFAVEWPVRGKPAFAGARLSPSRTPRR
jgi:membrane associated rhomboid family serine protease